MNQKAKILIITSIIIIIVELIILSLYLSKKSKQPYDDFVSYNGWLNVDGFNIKNEKGEEIQLVGVSSHAIQWFSDSISEENIQILKNNWGVNVIRLAVYTEVDNKFVYNDKTKLKLYDLMDKIIANDMYVIIDWHVLEEKDPNKYKKEAKEFFEEISLKYKTVPNVIYEICNEPNIEESNEWEEKIKPYAEEIIETIRSNSSKSLIIVGTPGWSKNFTDVIKKPLNYNNIAYALHFYAGEGDYKESYLELIIKNNIPVIVTEWGVTDSTGDGEIYTENSNKWISFLNKNKISWIVWSLSNKNEATAILIPEKTYEIVEEPYLTETGKFIRELIKKTKNK